ncbi:hypothetical protein W97_04611 [Coniosporium apollinis CBS 100218]|uniref:Thioesterase domain-containing protein n=1 Tax=Coniosporium apollinis (strain CBS 100218) TaxID=1168221 RepID=R7YU43_CONA1|nr:uncharacterized protein W97_04611 [Coniosporium apollinis CBS 100218]EON65373.1 hypothetical protein W97_04611 [Coniosporium apollinis CBS 100218]
MSFPHSLTPPSHFTHLPWCASLLSDASWTIVPTSSRTPKPSTEDSFFAETLQSPRTIRGCLPQHTAPDPTSDPPIREVRILLDLGDGLNGYPHTAHGGLVATLLDEAVGLLLAINMRFRPKEARSKETETGINFFTAYLNISYKAPLMTPGVVLARAGVEKVEGRKRWFWARLEDGRGLVFASAEALFVEARPKL